MVILIPPILTGDMADTPIRISIYPGALGGPGMEMDGATSTAGETIQPGITADMARTVVEGLIIITMEGILLTPICAAMVMPVQSCEAVEISAV